jgi:hypothetical protein
MRDRDNWLAPRFAIVEIRHLQSQSRSMSEMAIYQQQPLPSLLPILDLLN